MALTSEGFELIDGGKYRGVRMTVKEIVGKFKWDDARLVELLASFIDTRRSYWPAGNSMEHDLISFFQNVANEEDSWKKFDVGELVKVEFLD